VSRNEPRLSIFWEKMNFEMSDDDKLPIQIRTEIPSKSSGRTLDALTDIIRPISEGLGLLGDKLSLRRQKTLLEIARRTRERLSVISGEVQPPAPKFLIPLLEKASLEDLNETKLIDMWANLLATAATEPVEMIGQYTSILSETTSSQVLLMETILCLNGQELQRAGHFIDNYYYLNQTGLPGSIARFGAIEDAEKLAKALLDELDINGVAVDTLNIFYIDDADGPGTSISSPDGAYSDDKFYDFENLCRLGLLERIEVKRFKLGKFDIDVHYYLVTPVGIDLYACCNPTKLERERKEYGQPDRA
jgi:hypothetical protein